MQPQNNVLAWEERRKWRALRRPQLDRQDILSLFVERHHFERSDSGPRQRRTGIHRQPRVAACPAVLRGIDEGAQRRLPARAEGRYAERLGKGLRRMLAEIQQTIDLP